jgi:hypothetical protein
VIPLLRQLDIPYEAQVVADRLDITTTISHVPQRVEIHDTSCMGTSTSVIELDGKRRTMYRPDGSQVTIWGRMKRWPELEDGLGDSPPSMHPVLVPSACLKIETVLPNGASCRCVLPSLPVSSLVPWCHRGCYLTRRRCDD